MRSRVAGLSWGFWRAPSQSSLTQSSAVSGFKNICQQWERIQQVGGLLQTWSLPGDHWGVYPSQLQWHVLSCIVVRRTGHVQLRFPLEKELLDCEAAYSGLRLRRRTGTTEATPCHSTEKSVCGWPFSWRISPSKQNFSHSLLVLFIIHILYLSDPDLIPHW